jgi:excinuclease ABC subunit C
MKKLPDTPGIYYFKKGKQILYIGKATSLRSRVRSYSDSKISEKRSPWIAQMMAQVDKVDYKQTDSVLEALILESAEIKKHQPPYNTREKDDKSYLYVVITDEDFPRILSVRGKNLPKDENSRVFTPEEPHADKNFHFRSIFGPFPYGSELREALKIIRKIFPYRTNCKPQSGKLCFDAQIGLCPGICSGAVSQKDYGKTIRHLKLFFEGKKSQLIKTLEREMKAYAKSQELDKAGELKRKIFALQHIQDVALIKRNEDVQGRFLVTRFRVEAYDIAHISGKYTVGAMVVMQDGELDKSSYRKFKLKGLAAEKSDDIANLKEILERRFNHPEWPFPNLIVVDGGQAQVNVAKLVLENRGLKIPVIGVIKDEHHRAIKGYPDHVVLINQEVHRFALAYHRNRRDRVL